MNTESPATNAKINLQGPKYAVKQSGDGYEVLDANGEVIAWVLDGNWAWRILTALEQQSSASNELPDDLGRR